jgi:hypothetical protein
MIVRFGTNSYSNVSPDLTTRGVIPTGKALEIVLGGFRRKHDPLSELLEAFILGRWYCHASVW